MGVGFIQDDPNIAAIETGSASNDVRYYVTNGWPSNIPFSEMGGLLPEMGTVLTHDNVNGGKHDTIYGDYVNAPAVLHQNSYNQVFPWELPTATDPNVVDGNDELHGDGGSDTIDGGPRGAGNLDILTGGPGRNTLEGGDGEDLFVLEAGDGREVIADFELGVDTIGVAGGLSFDDLSFAGDEILVGDRTLAVLTGVDTALLSEPDFMLV